MDSGVPGAHRERVDSPPLHLTLLSLSFPRYLSPPAISLVPVDSGVPGSPRERGKTERKVEARWGGMGDGGGAPRAVDFGVPDALRERLDSLSLYLTSLPERREVCP